MLEQKTHNILGIPVACVDMTTALDAIETSIAQKSRIQIGVVNAAKVVNMRTNSALREAVLASDVIFADGMSIVWAGKVLGAPITERITGIDLMFGLLARANENRYRIFLLGARHAVVQEVRERIAEDYPHVQIVGVRDGYFKDEDACTVADDIAAAQPDIVFVAMTSPKKECFLDRWGKRIGAHVYHGVGGSFDVYAGLVTRAPLSWQRLGLEWLYRLLQEPGRLWKRYLVTNTVFTGMVVRERVLRRDKTSLGRDHTR